MILYEHSRIDNTTHKIIFTFIHEEKSFIAKLFNSYEALYDTLTLTGGDPSMLDYTQFAKKESNLSDFTVNRCLVLNTGEGFKDIYRKISIPDDVVHNHISWIK